MEEDRMSQLPDDILLLILDKIDTLEAIKTSILSHRWKNLRCLLPSLRFHLSLAAGHGQVKSNYLTIRSEFVSKLLLSHRDASAAVHDFHLSFDASTYYEVDRKFVEECVLYAINHGVQSLRLRGPTSLKLRLPAAFLACETLRELELGNSRSPVKVPGRLSLPNLKTFHLETLLVFDDDHDRMEPFSGLPELEKLLIAYSFHDLVIKAPKLRVLEITDFYKLKEISAPLLTSFRYESNMALECAEVNLPMLEQVHLDIHETSYQNRTNFVSMFHHLRNATTVSFTLDTIEILRDNVGPFEQTTPPFPNMKCLKVMEGRHGIRTVLQSVMNYLIWTFKCEVELSPSLSVVEPITDAYEY